MRSSEAFISKDRVIGRSAHQSVQDTSHEDLYIQGIQRQDPCKSFPGREPLIPRFRGIDTDDRDLEFVSYDPLVAVLKLNEVIPETELYVRNFRVTELDEILLARL